VSRTCMDTKECNPSIASIVLLSHRFASTCKRYFVIQFNSIQFFIINVPSQQQTPITETAQCVIIIIIIIIIIKYTSCFVDFKSCCLLLFCTLSDWCCHVLYSYFYKPTVVERSVTFYSSLLFYRFEPLQLYSS
jgi:hypothetical protein